MQVVFPIRMDTKLYEKLIYLSQTAQRSKAGEVRWLISQAQPEGIDNNQISDFAAPTFTKEQNHDS